MTNPNTSAKKTQVIDVLKRDYFLMIPELVRNWTADQHEKNRLSRSLAAFAIANLADVTPAQGANSIINGENDNGIDAIYFDCSQKFLWLVQAKAGNAPNMGDNKKFCDGIRDLIERRFDKFNQGFARLQPEVEASLDTNGLKIVGCNVYLKGDLGSHVVNDLNQLAEELNRFAPRFEWRDLNIEQTHSWLTAKHAITPVDYAQSDTFYWQHGYSTERDFIYVTTQNLSHEQLVKLSEEVGEERSLLVLCSAFRGKTDNFLNLTVKKIPKQILSRCEWGHDDYSLKIENLPQAPVKFGQLELGL
jgi:hypothetical protein